MNGHFKEFLWRLIPGGIASMVAVVSLVTGSLQPLEQMAYNRLVRLRGEQPWDDRLILIAIDDASIDKLGRFPWPRRYYTDLLKILTPAEPSVVAFDLIWSESSPDDKALAQAIEQQGRVVLAQAVDSQKLPLLPQAKFMQGATATGHILNSAQSDGVTRSIEPQVKGDLAFSLAIVQAYSLVQDPITLPSHTQPLYINWPGSAKQLRQYSFSDVIQNRVPSSIWRDRIVLVGVTGTGFDTLVTPFDHSPPVTGVYLHAAAVHTALQNTALDLPLQEERWLLVLVGGGLCLSLALSYGRTALQLLIGGLGILLWCGVAWVSMVQNQWIPVALPISLIAGVSLTVPLVERLRMNAFLQAQVNHLWQAYVPDLLSTLPQPDRLQVPSNQPASIQVAQQLAKLAEELGRSQSMQSTVARNLSIGLVATDRSGQIWLCNPVAQRDLSTYLGQSLRTVLVPEWLSASDWDAMVNALHQNKLRPAQEILHHDRWYRLLIEPLDYPVWLGTNRVQFDWQGWLLVIEDITADKQIAVNLGRQVEDLEAIARLKDEFLSTVSHELRTPLTNIQLATQLLKIAQTDDQRNQYLSMLERETLREGQLLKDLLDLQQLEQSPTQVTTVMVDSIEWHRWLPKIIAPFAQRLQLQGQIMAINLADDLPTLHSEVQTLERIVHELLDNACKFSIPQTPVSLSIVWQVDQFKITVTNASHSISSVEQMRIFEKFYRVQRDDPWQASGTGLGLALTQRLVQRLQGTISVISQGDTTEFTVLLPQYTQPQSAQLQPTQPPSR